MLKFKKEEIYSHLKTFFKSILTFLKSVIKHPYAFRYILLWIILVFFFIIITFPLNQLLQCFIDDFAEKNKIKVSIQDMDTHLWGESTFGMVEIELNDGERISINHATADISMSPWDIIFSKRLNGSVALNNFQFEGKSFNIQMSANANSDLTFNAEGIPSDGEARIMGRNIILKIIDKEAFSGSLGFPLPFDSMTISSFMIQGTVKKSTLQLERGNFNGKDIRGKLSGTVKIGPRASSTELDILLSINIDSPALSDVRELIQGPAGPDNLLDITIKGTAARPSANIKKD